MHKFEVMHIGKNNPRYVDRIKIENEVQIIKPCDQETDLGVNFDCKLSFDSHI